MVILCSSFSREVLLSTLAAVDFFLEKKLLSLKTWFIKKKAGEIFIFDGLTPHYTIIILEKYQMMSLTRKMMWLLVEESSKL